MARMITLLCLVAILAADARAQSSGRHRDTPPPGDEVAEEVTEEAEIVVVPTASGSWFFMASAGLAASGDVLRVSTEGVSGIPWNPPGGPEFQSEDFTLTLDEAFALSFSLGRRLTSRTWLRADVGLAEMQVTALARVGQTAEVYRWDELAFWRAAVAMEYRFLRRATTPLIMAGVAVVDVAGAVDDGLDQTRLGWRIGAGYNVGLGAGWSLRAEVRDTIVWLQMEDYRPPVGDGADYPNATVENLGPQHLVEALVGVVGEF
jgi:opacity protein-like surface antigen